MDPFGGSPAFKRHAPAVDSRGGALPLFYRLRLSEIVEILSDIEILLTDEENYFCPELVWMR